jgi:cytoskeletal protein RodZ
MMKARMLFATAAVIGGAVFAGASPVAASTGARAATPVCGPKAITQHPAPGVGHQTTYKVKRAGTVTIREQSTTSLEVTDADANSGWKDTVITKTGARVHVGFQQIGAPEEQERFWARLNTVGTPGTMITHVLQSCT